jgi:hypothetical protein
MHNTLSSSLVLGATLLLLGTIATEAVGSRTGSTRSASALNPCLHELEGSREALEDQSRPSMERLTSAGWRQKFGLVQWPRDSVRATTDSVVCSHLDSLLSVWMASSEAESLGVSRGEHWPGINVVRVNPHRYIVSPPLFIPGGFMWGFIIDSVSGQVQFEKRIF